MFISLLRFPTALADRQKVEFLMEVMFLSRRIHESVPNKNQQTSTGGAAVGQSHCPLRWGQADLEAAGRLLVFIYKDRCLCHHMLAIYTFLYGGGVFAFLFLILFICLGHFTDTLQFVAFL